MMKPDGTDGRKPLLNRETWERWAQEDVCGGLDPLLVELSDVLPPEAFKDMSLQ